jgi:hypothetical protein
MSTPLGTIPARDHETTDRGVTIMPSPDTRNELPEADEHGDVARWVFPDRDGTVHTITGAFLGMGSSYRPEHKGHPDTGWAPQKVHCSTCRWTEVRLFRAEDRKLYVVNCGASDVPGERDFIQVSFVETPFELVESLTVVDRRTRQTVLPMPARRALAAATSHDREVRDAYINSPVT